MTSRRAFLLDTLRTLGGVALVATACGPAAGSAPTSAPAAPTAAAAARPPVATGAPATAAAVTAPATVKRGGQLVVADITDPKSLDPALITDRTGARAQRAIYDPLIDLDDNSTLVPGLAESWEIAPDARSVTLHLGKGVKFHDGTPFDAGAVQAHFARHMDPATKSLRTGELVNVASVDAVDPATVRIALKEPNRSSCICSSTGTRSSSRRPRSRSMVPITVRTP